MADYEFKTVPFAHQLRSFEEHREREAWGHLWGMGTGKSKLIIDTASWLHQQGAINGLLIVAPPSVHHQWVADEIPRHMPDATRELADCMVWLTLRAGTLWHQRAFTDLLATHPERLAVLCISYNGFMTKRGKRAVANFLDRRRCLYVLDESWAIKTPGAKRTKSIVASGRYAPFTRILNGTPVPNGPFDIYSQVRFLDEHFWKRRAIPRFHNFKHMFAVYGKDDEGKDNPFPSYYHQLNILQGWVREISDRVLKEDVLDLPPKLYRRATFELTPEQRRIYNQLKEEFLAELDDGAEVTAPLIIQRLTRFRQITSGFLPTDDGPTHRFDPNPRLGPLEEWRDGCSVQGIVWANYDQEIDDCLAILGPGAVRFDGKVSDEQRERNKAKFLAGDAQWFVSKASVGGAGLNLTVARSVLYYTNSYNLLQREQSEDRPHRIGQEHPVDYTDVVASNTVDVGILTALRKKFDVSSLVTGDEVRSWL